MLFGFQPVSAVDEYAAGTSEVSGISMYVATNMSPIEQVSPTDELRTAIKQSSPKVQALFEEVMLRVE